MHIGGAALDKRMNLLGGASPPCRGTFRFRLAERKDLTACFELLPAGFRARIPARQQLIGLCERLLLSEAA